MTVTNSPAVIDRIQSYLTACVVGVSIIGHSAKFAVPLSVNGDYLTGCCKVRNCSLIECRSTTLEPVQK